MRTPSDYFQSAKGPGVYTIVVCGELDSRWSDRLGGMKISNGENPDEPESIIKGLLKDQSALIGILETLFQWQLPIKKIDRVNDEEVLD